MTSLIKSSLESDSPCVWMRIREVRGWGDWKLLSLKFAEALTGWHNRVRTTSFEYEVSFEENPDSP